MKKNIKNSKLIILICGLIFIVAGCSNILLPQKSASVLPITSTPFVEVTSTSIESTKISTEVAPFLSMVNVSSCKYANQIRDMTIDPSGYLWTTGPGGIVQWDIQNDQPAIYVLNKICSEYGTAAISLTSTINGNVWVGTDGYGLFQFDGNIWRSHSTKDGLPGNHIRNLVGSSDGTLWVDTAETKIFHVSNWEGTLGKYDGTTWEEIFKESNFYRIVENPDGGLLIITQSTWLPQIYNFALEYHGNRIEEIIHHDYSDLYTAIAISPNGEIWLSSEKGVFRFDGSAWHKLIPPWTGKTINKVVAMAVDNNGTVWFGLSFNPFDSTDKCGYRMGNDESGVYSFDGQNWQHFTTENGLIDNKICAIATTIDGSVWFGSFDKGLSRFDGNMWTTYSVP